MPAEPHPLDCGGRIGVVQIQQNVASVAVIRIGLKVHVTAFSITNAQESQRRLLAQLSDGPQPFSRECGSSGVVNQPNQIEITRHRGKLSSDRAQRKEQPTTRHKHNGRRANSPYNALMLCLRGRKSNDKGELTTLRKGANEMICLATDPKEKAWPTLFGLDVVSTTNISNGTFLVGSGNPAACEIRDRLELQVELSTEHADFFVKNLVALRAEKRLALVVRRPASFIAGSFTTSP
jgi:hypothetical protein